VQQPRQRPIREKLAARLAARAVVRFVLGVNDVLHRRAAAGDVLISNTVRDLVAGSGIEFASRGQAFLGERLGEWSLFEVERVER
jgi:hypothetical protein